MRYDQTCEDFAKLAQKQSHLACNAPTSFFVGAMLAGAFVAMAMILALSVGAHLDPGIRPLVMGAVFGVSILLAIFGGGELFTGQAMFVTFALLRAKFGPLKALHLLGLAWTGNLAGAVLICGLFALGGGGHVFGPSSPLLHDLVIFKSQSSLLALLARAILCNWLACLGIWTASRLKHESAKMLVLSWCVMTYVACGLEHSIANMALFALGLMAPTPSGDLISAAASVAIVSLGNVLGGGLLVAASYAFYSRGEKPLAAHDAVGEDLNLPHLAPAAKAMLGEFGQDRLGRAA